MDTILFNLIWIIPLLTVLVCVPISANHGKLLKTIHATEVRPEDMPDMKAVAVDWVEFLKDYLAPDKWQKLKSLVSAVPEGHKMIHGDYHTKNVDYIFDRCGLN